jgi:hypothetical protein
VRVEEEDEDEVNTQWDGKDSIGFSLVVRYLSDMFAVQ